jgi:hypothetical protein
MRGTCADSAKNEGDTLGGCWRQEGSLMTNKSNDIDYLERYSTRGPLKLDGHLMHVQDIPRNIVEKEAMCSRSHEWAMRTII